MLRAALALSVLLATLPLEGQRRGGGGIAGRPTRAPGRIGTIPGLGPPTVPTAGPPERAIGEPVRPGPIPLPSARREWLRIETTHFSIFSSTSERLTRQIALDLERLTNLLVGTSPYFRLSPRRTRVFLFGDPRDARPYFDAARGMRIDAAGLTVRHPAGSTILIDVTMRGGKDMTARHELVHDLLGNNGRPLPLWIEEGLAEYDSNRGRPIVEHVFRLRGKPRIPIDQLFTLRGNSLRAASWDFYAQSWGAVSVLLRRDPVAFEAFVRDVDQGTPPDVALAARFQMTTKELEDAIRLKCGRPASSILAEDVTFDAEIEPLSRAALLSELGELLARLPNRAFDADRHRMAALEAETIR